jgi:hypothetical protein
MRKCADTPPLPLIGLLTAPGVSAAWSVSETVWRRADLPVGIHDRPVRPRRQRHTELANDPAVVKPPIFFETFVVG